MKCPACKNPLREKGAGGMTLDVCYGGCGGIWFDAKELDRVSAQAATTLHTIWAVPGYDLIDRPKVEWNITTGPAYQYAWFESAQPGEPTEKGTGALCFGSRFDWDITHRMELILEYRGQYTKRQVGETTHHSVSTLSLELTKRFDLDVSFTWDRITQPKVGADGVEPQPDDFRLVVGLGVDF